MNHDALICDIHKAERNEAIPGGFRGYVTRSGRSLESDNKVGGNQIVCVYRAHIRAHFEQLEVHNIEASHGIAVKIAKFARPGTRCALGDESVEEGFFVPQEWMFFYYDRSAKRSIQILCSSLDRMKRRVFKRVEMEAVPLANWHLDSGDVLKIGQERPFVLLPLDQLSYTGRLSLTMTDTYTGIRPVWETPFLALDVQDNRALKVHVAADEGEIMVLK